MDLAIVNGRVLLPSGQVEEAVVWIDCGHIVEISSRAPSNGARVLDAEGGLVLPGMIDLHGDAFERQMMPRPGTFFPTAMALAESDRQLVANGITTAYYGVTYSWEPGLRGHDSVCDLLDVIDEQRPHLHCDTKVHMRWEVFNLAAEPQVAAWMRQGRIHLLAFNDHIDHISHRARQPETLSSYLQRTGMDTDGFLTLLRATEARANEVPGAIDRLAAIAVFNGITLASHDDETPEMRRRYNDVGCTVCEFPLDEATADASRALGNPIVLGGPNVVRDGSHCARLHAATSVAEGRCDILTSDYYYPSMLQAAFILVEKGYADLPTAWRLVSSGPAEAAGLTDRGTIETGKRADIIVVDDTGLPTPRATLVAGRTAHRSVHPLN